MRCRRLWLMCVLVLAASGSVALGNGRAPTITGFGPDPARGENMTVLVMGTRFLYVSVPPDQREIVDVRWEILRRATGYERLASESGAWSTDLEVYWGEPEAVVGQPVVGNWDGEEIHVRATVTFKEAEEGDVPWTHTFVFTVEGVNQPPIPVISGNLGTPENPLRPSHAGVGVNIGLDAYESTVPGLPVMGTWNVLRIRGAAGIRWMAFGGGFGGLEITMQFQNINFEAEADIILYLGGGLQLTSTTRTVYLAPFDGDTSPPPGAGNGAPTLTVHPASVTVAQGQTFSVVATATDPDGDTLAFVWTGRDGSTINASYVSSRRTSAAGASPSTFTSTLTHPTSGMAAGTHQFSVQAFETNTAQLLSSPRVYITAVVEGEPGGGETPPPPENQAPEPKIRYDLGATGQFLGPHPGGHTVSTQARVILLDAGASTDDGGYENLSFRWGKGFLEPGSFQSLTSPQTTLTLPATAQGKVTVSLTATDSGGKSATVTLAFQLLAANEPPVAKIRYSEGEDELLKGPFSSGYVVETGVRTILLDAGASTDDGGLENLQFSWAAGGLAGASLSAAQGMRTTLTVPVDAAGDVTVSLTVTDQGDLTSTSSLVFRFSIAIPELSASIVSAPPSVQSGQEFSVEGVGHGSEGNGGLRYIWTAVCGEGQAVRVYSSGPRAKVVAPRLNGGLEEDWVTVSLVVRENGFDSEPALIEIPVTRPTLYFAQAAVGGIDAARRFETAIVLVNPTDDIAEGSVLFVNNFHGEGWTVRVDGVPQSEMPFELMPGEAAEFVLTGTDVEIGWLKIRSNVALVGHLFYRVVEVGSGYVLSEAPILPVVGRGFRTALGRGSNDGVAIAMVNLGRGDVRFRVRAVESDGRVFETDELMIGPGEHMARFLGEMLDGLHYSDARIPSDFSGGTLIIELVDGDGSVTATIIRTRDGLPLSILPVATPQ